ncbi:hypothetical protein BT93_A2324 [Corymbia citriodora subsp. variegata]|nr:hypothetical protein BT93_A2324 [Corymbia citriodora subsp. variegata]
MLELRWPSFTAAILRLIDGCKNMRELKQIHAQLTKSPYIPNHDAHSLITRLLSFCALSPSGSLSYATSVFGCIKNPNLYVYNILIRAYSSKIDAHDSEKGSCRSLGLYKRMVGDGISPDCLTFPFLLKECARRVDTDTGRAIHGQVVKFGFGCDIYINNSMISMYSARCSLAHSARKLFDEMLGKDVVSWNSMIMGYLRSGNLDAALDLYRRMEQRNIVTWNSIITGFAQGGRPKEALQFFHEMQSAGGGIVRPDKITIASILSACASLGALDHGKWVHTFLSRSGIECDMVIRTALIDMYGKCGAVDRALEIFRKMPNRDNLAFTAMISVFALHGFCEEASSLFEEMEKLGMKPNHVTFVALLSACAHSGLVQKGRWYFDVMKRVYSIEPQVYHYACMVDMLGRAGLFEEAERLIKNMPMEPDVFVWGALLAGCQMHGNVELGERVAKYLIDLDPLNHVFYVSLRDMYAKAGRLKDLKVIKSLMKGRQIRKEVPGHSMIEIDGIVHEFSVRGSSEVRMEELLFVLTCLGGQC